jgi:hypothetical protein
MISNEISYGLFLGNFQILGEISSELVILPAVLCQNLRLPTRQHLRRCLQLGIKKDDIEQIHRCVEMIARFCERPVDNVERISDIPDNIYSQFSTVLL